MAVVVVDASVLAALYVDDPASDDSAALLARLGRERAELHAPDLLLLEVANVLWKRVRSGQVSASDAMAAIADLTGAPIQLRPAQSLAQPALGLALAHGLTAYDAAYLAVAAQVGSTLVTNDRALLSRAAEAGLPATEPAGLG